MFRIISAAELFIIANFAFSVFLHSFRPFFSYSINGSVWKQQREKEPKNYHKDEKLASRGRNFFLFFVFFPFHDSINCSECLARVLSIMLQKSSIFFHFHFHFRILVRLLLLTSAAEELFSSIFFWRRSSFVILFELKTRTCIPFTVYFYSVFLFLFLFFWLFYSFFGIDRPHKTRKKLYKNEEKKKFVIKLIISLYLKYGNIRGYFFVFLSLAEGRFFSFIIFISSALSLRTALIQLLDVILLFFLFVSAIRFFSLFQRSAVKNMESKKRKKNEIGERKSLEFV